MFQLFVSCMKPVQNKGMFHGESVLSCRDSNFFQLSYMNSAPLTESLQVIKEGHCERQVRKVIPILILSEISSRYGSNVT